MHRQQNGGRLSIINQENGKSLWREVQRTENVCAGITLHLHQNTEGKRIIEECGTISEITTTYVNGTQQGTQRGKHAGLHSFADVGFTKASGIRFYGISEGESTMEICKRNADLKWNFDNRHFWTTGYYDSAGVSKRKL